MHLHPFCAKTALLYFISTELFSKQKSILRQRYKIICRGYFQAKFLYRDDCTKKVEDH